MSAIVMVWTAPSREPLLQPPPAITARVMETRATALINPFQLLRILVLSFRISVLTRPAYPRPPSSPRGWLRQHGVRASLP